MKRFLTLLLVFAAPLAAEQVTLKQSAVMRADHNIVSIKAGTVVELVSRDGDRATIVYHDLTGTIPASKLDDAKTADAPKPGENKSDSAPANPPQTNYGREVQKAKDNASEHEKNIVQPTNEVLKEN